MPQAGTLTIDLDRPAAKGDLLDLTISYEGKITEWNEWSANVIGEDWTELGLYFPWFPYNQNCGGFTFRVDVDVPDGYSICGNGTVRQVGQKQQIHHSSPVNDIIISAGPNILTESVKTEGSFIHVYYSRISRNTAVAIADDVNRILQLYGDWFGAKKQNVHIIESLREKGGGYSRKGTLVLGGLNDKTFSSKREAYLRYLAHETAHFWWNMADSGSWDDWLNEGFAEYCALLVIRDRFGEDAFSGRIMNKKDHMKGIPPLWEFNRGDVSTEEKRQITEALLYSKAPVLLDALKKKMGFDSFIALCRAMIIRKIRTTGDMLDLLQETEGKTIRDWFELLLKMREENPLAGGSHESTIHGSIEP